MKFTHIKIEIDLGFLSRKLSEEDTIELFKNQVINHKFTNKIDTEEIFEIKREIRIIDHKSYDEHPIIEKYRLVIDKCLDRVEEIHNESSKKT